MMTNSPGRKEFLLRLPYELFNDAKSHADRDRISITEYVNRAIATYVEATDLVDEIDRKNVPPPEKSTAWWLN